MQLKNGPFDLDLVFAPDGIERFEDAWRRRVDVEGFPVCHLDDIIASKAASNQGEGPRVPSAAPLVPRVLDEDGLDSMTLFLPALAAAVVVIAARAAEPAQDAFN